MLDEVTCFWNSDKVSFGRNTAALDSVMSSGSVLDDEVMPYVWPVLQVVYELPTNNQWSFDVQWCPRNPGLISSSTFDGHVGVYSLMGGGHPIQPSNKVCGLSCFGVWLFVCVFVCVCVCV